MNSWAQRIMLAILRALTTRQVVLIAFAIVAMTTAILRLRGVARAENASPPAPEVERLEKGAKAATAVSQPIPISNAEQERISALLRQLPEPNNEARVRIFEDLARSRDPRLEKVFLTGLNDPYAVVRWRSMSGLGHLQSKAAVESLLVALSSKESGSRTNAAEALGQIGDHRALEPVARMALTDSDPYVRISAGRVLGELSHPNRQQNEIAWGEAVDGIQLGLQCDLGVGPHRYGEVIRFHRLVRNLGKRTWKFRVGSGGLIFSHAKSDKINLHSNLHLGGVYSEHTAVVPANAVMGIDSTDFMLLPEKNHIPRNSLHAKPGTYSVRTNLTRSWSVSADDIANDPELWVKPLSTGELKFIVRANGD